MSDDLELVERLRRGDELAFTELVLRYHARLVGLARPFVGSSEAAEDSVQDTWLAVIRGIERFEGRSTLKAWLFQICVNRARTSGERDHRIVPIGDVEPSVDPARFDGHGGWVDPPTDWSDRVDNQLEAAGLIDRVRSAIDRLPEAQNLVVTFRDVEGLTAEEVCEVLSISATNQRVLLHRGRSAVRRSLEGILGQ